MKPFQPEEQADQTPNEEEKWLGRTFRGSSFHCPRVVRIFLRDWWMKLKRIRSFSVSFLRRNEGRLYINQANNNGGLSHKAQS